MYKRTRLWYDDTINETERHEGPIMTTNLKRDFVTLTAIAPLLFAALAVAWFGVNTYLHDINVGWRVGTSEQLMDIRPHAKGSQPAVIARAGCVEAPEGVFPSSVVADPKGPRSWTHFEGDTALGHAFEQLVFDGVLEANEWTKPVDHGMNVGVFCK